MSRPSDFRQRSRRVAGGNLAAGLKQAIVALLLVAASSRLGAQDQSATSISHEVKDIWEHASKAVVKVHGVDEHSEIFGTGFFIDPTGTLYTSYTVGGEA